MKKIKYPSKELGIIINLLFDLDTDSEKVKDLLQQINKFDIDLKDYLTKYTKNDTFIIGD